MTISISERRFTPCVQEVKIRGKEKLQELLSSVVREVLLHIRWCALASHLNNRSHTPTPSLKNI